MQLGVHLIQRSALPALAARQVRVPEPWLGVVDLLRMIEGLRDEPQAGQPLGVVGLDELLVASLDADDTLRLVRRGIVDARRYLDWQKIPVCLLVSGRIVRDDDGSPSSTVRLHAGERSFAVERLTGQGLKPMDDDQKEPRWWWTPQLG